MTETIELEITVESLTAKEKFLIKRLREYRTIDGDIRVQERLMKGNDLIHEPRITAAAPVRDYMAWFERVGYALSDEEHELIETLKKHVTFADIARLDDSGRIRLTYASSDRIAKLISRRFSDNPEEDAKLQRAYELLLSKQKELFVHLTDTELIVEQRLAEREEAERRYNMLVSRRDIVKEALDMLQQWFPSWHGLLWHKYVMDEPRDRVCMLLARSGVSLTLKEYRNERRKALRQFDKWTRGLK